MNSNFITQGIIKFEGSEENTLVATHFAPLNPVSGPPVLFMHGGGQTRHSWHGAAHRVAELGLHAFAVDGRGHGDSEWVASKKYALKYYCNDLAKLAGTLADQHGTPPVLIGASLGGLSGMLVVDDYSDNLFSAIVLVDITPRMTESGVDKIQGFMAEKMEEGFATVEEAADAIAAYLPDRPRPKSLDGLRKNLRQRDDGRFYWHWDPGFLKGPHSIDSGRGERQSRLFDACRKITIPALLVRGAKSELVTEQAAREFQHLVSHAHFVDVSDAGHMVAGDKNDVFAQAVIEFLQKTVL